MIQEVQLNGTNAAELLQFLAESGKINLGDAEESMRKAKLALILKEHPYTIYQGKDGRWHTYVNEGENSSKRRKISKSTEEKIHEALYELYSGIEAEKKKGAITIESLYPEWLEHKALHTNSKGTIKKHNVDWNKYYKDTPITKVPIHTLRKLDLDEWAHRLVQERAMTKKQYTNMKTIMNQLMDYAVDREIIDINLSRRVRVANKLFVPVRKKPSETQVYSDEELKAVKKLAWEDYHNKAKRFELAPLALIFQFVTGVRLGEVCALRHEDVKGSSLFVRRMVVRDERKIVEHTKGGHEEREVLLVDEALEIIKTCKERQQELGVDSEGYIFSVNGEYCSYYAVYDLYRKYCDELGIIRKSSHKARKTFISALYDGAVNINTIREMVGHVDEKTTLSNYCFDRKSKDERLELIEKALS